MDIDKKEKEETTIARLVNENSHIDGEDNRNKTDDQVNASKASNVSRSTESQAGSVAIFERLQKANMLVKDSGLCPTFYDEYRRIKRPLISNAFGRSSSLIDRGNMILVTSSLPGEGKTHTAINLALSIAQERDRTVLLVDCDAVKQGVSSMMGVESMRGLVEVLENDNYTIADVLLRTDIQNLTLVPAGLHSEYITELLASQRMADIVDEISTRYDDRIIIFDGPPLIPTPQCQILIGLVGQVTFVVESAKTPQDVVLEALEMIPEEKAVGLIMNKSEGSSSRSGYYQSYYDKNDTK